MLGVQATAREYQLSPDMLRRWIRRGALPAQRIGGTYVLRREDVEAFLEAGVPRVGRPRKVRSVMLTGVRAIEFETQVQDADERASVPEEIATAMGLGDDAPVVIKAWDGKSGDWQVVDDRLRSGKEIYGSEFARLARRGNLVRLRLEL